MASKNIAAFGMYRDPVAVGEAVDALKCTGFRSTDISILLPDNIGSKDFAHEKHTKVPEGTAAGALCASLIGAIVGWLLATGTIAIAALASFTAAGPFVAVLSGIGAGSVLGGLIGALIGFGIPEYEAKRYEGRVRKAGILLSVHCDNLDWAKRAKDTLRHSGAEGIAARGEARADFGAAEKPLARTRLTGILDQSTSTSAPAVEPQVEDPGSSDRPLSIESPPHNL